MKLILYFGHTGTTKKAAELLAAKLLEVTILDGRAKQRIDYTLYDHLVFGINVRMGKLNKAFYHFYKKLKKKGVTLPCSAFIIAGDLNQRAKYMNLAKAVLPEDSYVGFFGGEFNIANAKGITKRVLKSCIDNFMEQDLPLPELELEAIEDFAQHLS